MDIKFSTFAREKSWLTERISFVNARNSVYKCTFELVFSHHLYHNIFLN